MEVWDTSIDEFLFSDDRDILKNTDKISLEIAFDIALTDSNLKVR